MYKNCTKNEGKIRISGEFGDKNKKNTNVEISYNLRNCAKMAIFTFLDTKTMVEQSLVSTLECIKTADIEFNATLFK